MPITEKNVPNNNVHERIHAQKVESGSVIFRSNYAKYSKLFKDLRKQSYMLYIVLHYTKRCK